MMEGSIVLMNNQCTLHAKRGQKKLEGIDSNDELDKLASIQLKNILNVKCDNEKKISKNPKLRHLQSINKDKSVCKYDCKTLEAKAIIAATTTTTKTTLTTTVAKRNPFSDPIKAPTTNSSHSSSCSLPNYFTNSSNVKPNVIKTKQFTNKNCRKQASGAISNSTSTSVSTTSNIATTKSSLISTATSNSTSTTATNNSTRPATPKVVQNSTPKAVPTTAVSTLTPSTASASTSPPSTPSTTANSTATATLTVTSTAATVSTTNFTLTPIVHRNKGGHFKIPSDMLDDLASRFIINSPEVEQTNLIRLCFQLEMAHWFYLDFFTAVDEAERKERKLFPCGIKSFAAQMFQHIPFLNQHAPNVETILDDWKNYKLSVPTYGAILLSSDLKFCLLVQSYFSKSSWGFPKGKVNEHERPEHCAAREVFEETGFNISDVISTNDFIEANINYQYTRLYVVPNVSLETQFSPRTRNEIKSCDWFPIDSLPTNRNDAITKAKLGLNANSFFMIIPFVKRLKRRVQELRDGINLPNPATMGLSALSSSPTNTPANNSFFNNQKNSGKKNKSILNSKNGANTTTPSGNRVKRQRHKSMGDLENTQLAGPVNSHPLQSQKIVGTVLQENPEVKKEQLTIPNDHVTNGSNGNNGSNHKRNPGKFNAAGSNSTNNHNNGLMTKRQLFHSQSHNGTTTNEKNIATNNSLDQMQPSKVQNVKLNITSAGTGAGSYTKYGQNNFANGNGNAPRARAQSQSEQVSPHQQPVNSSGTIIPFLNNTCKYNGNGNNSSKNTKQRAQKSFSYCNGNDSGVGMVAALDNGLSQTHKENDVNSSNRTATPTKNLIHMLALSNNTVRPAGNDVVAYNDKNDISLYANGFLRQPQGMQKVRPASVGVSETKNFLHLMRMPSANNLRYPTYEKHGAIMEGNQEEPIASVKKIVKKESPKTNKTESVEHIKEPLLQFGQVRLLQRGNSLDALQLLNEQTKSADHKGEPIELNTSDQGGVLPKQVIGPQNQTEQQAQIFTPSSDYWTNFSFTKNFISNVFC